MTEADPPADAPTLLDLIDRRRNDDTLGIIADDRRWTWRQAIAESQRFAVALNRLLGDAEPRHVGLLMENTPNYLFALLGGALAGITSVGINSTRRGDELARDIRHTDCALVLTESALAPRLDGLDLGAAGVHVLDGPGWTGTLAAGGTFVPTSVKPENPLLLIFTSGSTSAPKAVIMSHHRAAGMGNGSAWFTADDVLYCAMPLSHGNALNAIVFPALASGATIALREHFSASRFVDDWRLYGATFFTSVGRAIGHVLATPERPDDRDHQVRYGLAPESSPADIRAFRRRFGVHCVSGYGSSEGALAMVPVPGMPKDALGRPQEGTEVAIVDAETGNRCPTAEFDDDGRMLNADEAIGEIVGLNVASRFEGYYRNPEANSARTRNGWFWSGDLGYVDADGFYFFAGRQGDWLRVDSENFAAAPVERILGRFPRTSAVSVFAVPDERTADDQVMVALELERGAAFDAEGFAAFLDEQPDLSPKWRPRYVRITSLPVGATNKIDRRRLRDERWFTTDPVFWRRERESSYEPLSPADLAGLQASFEAHGRSIERR